LSEPLTVDSGQFRNFTGILSAGKWNFIGWKVAEQVEEVASVEYVLTLTKTASSQRDLFMLEGKVGKLVAAKKGH